MLFATIDYLKYRLRVGRYARYSTESEMGVAFLGALPDEAVRLLKPGDCLLTSDYDSVISWAIMYLTSSEVSHVAILVDNGVITHATLSGVATQPISELYDAKRRILPLRLRDDMPRDEIRERALSLLGTPYSWVAVRRKLLWILSGRDAPYFRWRFATDIGLLLLVLDIPIILLASKVACVWAMLPYLGIILFNLARWRTNPLPADHRYAKPADMLAWLKAEHGRRIVDAAALQIQQSKIQRE